MFDHSCLILNQSTAFQPKAFEMKHLVSSEVKRVLSPREGKPTL